MKAEFYARKLTKTAIRWIEVESFKGMETIHNRNDGNKRKKGNQAFSQCSNHYIDEEKQPSKRDSVGLNSEKHQFINGVC